MMRTARRAAALLTVLLTFALPVAAGRLDGTIVEHLPNGLTVMILEDHTLPIVSVQMLYRVGARNEQTGATGLAHFLEHMAYRATERFPDTDVVSRLYGVGGEWHGYTWIDQTTYFETVPREHLPLALDIEADRMARLLLPEKELEAERGAVLTELHGYENDPAAVLHDAVAAASFTQHPYRQNVIGWTSDVERITHADIASFYRQHYRPANAVLAVAGDLQPTETLALVRKTFEGIAGGAPTPLPRTVEPPQTGERRVTVPHVGTGLWFQISYRAPAATDPDYPAFLLIQALLGGSTGASFRQDGDPIPARPGTRLNPLNAIGEEISTTFAATAKPYLFTLAGKAETEGTIETEIESRIAALREGPVPADELDRARTALLTDLELDVETPEDAAHEMAYFEGIGAFEIRKRLPELVSAVTAEDIRRAASAWLQPTRRTIGWSHPGPPPPATLPKQSTALPPAPPPPPPMEAASPAPRVKTLRNGITLIVRRLPRVPAGYLRVVVPGDSLTFEGVDASVDEPAWRHTSLGVRFRAGELAQAVAEIRKAMDTAVTEPPTASDDPELLLDRALRDALGAVPTATSPSPQTPVVIVAVGDLDEEASLRLLEQSFSTLPNRHPLAPLALQVQQSPIQLALPGRAQSQIGYAVPVPPASPESSIAWRMLLYLAAHDYEGRLGKELIARRGLLYYIGTAWHTDGRTSWLALTAGVNPDRLDETATLFFGLLDAFRDHPPTEAEVEEARQHLIGRRLTAPMSNEELTAAYAQEQIEQGRLLTNAEWEREVRAVRRDDLLKILPAFLAGVRVVVDVREPAQLPDILFRDGKSFARRDQDMRMELLRSRRAEILRLAALHGATNVRVFGSVARGEADDQSDIDFLVDMGSGRSLLDLGAFLDDLQRLLRQPVDIVTERGLKARIRDRLLREAVPL